MTTQPLRVVAVTQSDPFFTGRFFDAFLREAASLPIQLVEIVLLRNFNESRWALATRLWRLYGTVDFARLLGRYGVARIAERFFGRPSSVEAIAARHGIPTVRLTTINDTAYLDTLGARRVDVLLSVAAPELFKAALKSAPAVLNVHCGKLPRYRGMMPTFWALHQGDDHIVITVHEMVAQLDAGAVLSEYTLPIQPGDTAFDLAVRAKVVAGREVARLLAGRQAAPPTPRALDQAGQRYFRFPTRRHARELRAAGRRLL